MASGFWFRQVAGCQVPITARFGEPRVRDWRRGRERQWLNPAEDWADSVFAYVYHKYAAQEDAEISESRWYFVGRQMNPGNPDRFAWPEEWRSIEFDDTLFKDTIPSEDR
jgi:hypothetical protein